MSQPIVFVTTHSIKDGKVAEFKEHNSSVVQYMRDNRPGTIAFLTYLDEEEREVSIVHVFPNAQAMDKHMEGISERAAAAAELLEFGKLEIFGKPSDSVLAQMQSAKEAGVTVRIKPNNLSGYLRFDSEGPSR